MQAGKVVKGGPRNDVLIGTARAQTILGGRGDDRICAGGGNDTVRGQGGDDTIHGEGKGDTLFGNGGSDRIHGDILDDHLFGGSGDDSLIGGHGVDKMFGGPGDDLLRGGTNRDCLYGQGGTNTASFGTATPPGPVDSSISGVRVELDRPTKGACPKRGTGRVDGDGTAEALQGIDFVIGSAFADAIGGVPGSEVDAGLGSDACSGFGPSSTAGCGGGDEKPAGSYAYVFEPGSNAPRDPGLIVVGADGTVGEAITLSGSAPQAGTPDGARVTTVGDPLIPGPGCDAQGTCTPTQHELGYVVAYGADGADTISVGAGLPTGATVDLDGGPGDDVLNGSDYIGEVLFGGDFVGADVLKGGGGVDALVSEGGGPAAGPDDLSGGSGDDQLVADYPCAGHSFSGGPGVDVAGFARGGVGIRATIGGVATLAAGDCPSGDATTILLDNEVLEGGPKADHLTGSAGPDTLWGREGDDVLIGLGGADVLQGFAGRDRIDALDRRRDRLIHCGSDRDRAPRHDRIDPSPISC